MVPHSMTSYPQHYITEHHLHVITYVPPQNYITEHCSHTLDYVTERYPHIDLCSPTSLHHRTPFPHYGTYVPLQDYTIKHYSHMLPTALHHRTLSQHICSLTALHDQTPSSHKFSISTTSQNAISLCSCSMSQNAVLTYVPHNTISEHCPHMCSPTALHRRTRSPLDKWIHLSVVQVNVYLGCDSSNVPTCSPHNTTSQNGVRIRSYTG